MACLIQIYRPACVKCDELATFELIDSKNAKRGRYCEKHGQAALRELHEQETAAKGGR